MRLPRDWVVKALVAALFVAVASLVLVWSWAAPLENQLPATVRRLDAVPEGETAARYILPDTHQFPFVKQAIERAEKAGGSVSTIVPRPAWEGWVLRVLESQPGASPELVLYRNATWEFSVADRSRARGLGA